MDANYSSLISDNSRDENQLAKIVAAEAAGLELLADLVASLKHGNYQAREEAALSEAIAGEDGLSRADLRGD